MSAHRPASTARWGERRVLLGSVTRIAGLEGKRLEARKLSRESWHTGDYVLAEVEAAPRATFRVEVPTGRLVELLPGDLLVGSLGRRSATLALVGDWRAIADDGRMDTLNAAGVIGRITSASVPARPSAALRYSGHVLVAGRRIGMRDCVGPVQPRALQAPVVLIIGTSMSAGKTVAGRAIVRSLKRMGLRVAATKLTGVGRYRDILAMGDAGADSIADFVDAGLPSTVVDREEFGAATELLLSMLAASEPDVVVAEAGASPLEPYNGDTAVDLLGERIRCTVLCASDPYAVRGVIDAFGKRPDLISGPATSTDAAIALIDKLAGIPAVNLLETPSDETLDELLAGRLGQPVGSRRGP